MRNPRTLATTLALLVVAAGLLTMAGAPATADPGDEPETGAWAEDGSTFREMVRLSSDDPSADPMDWYRINLTSGPTEVDYLRIDVNMTRNGAQQLFVWASLHDPDGAMLTEVKATSYAVKSTATLCHRTGVYLVRVYTYSYFDCHYQLSFNVTRRANVTDGDDTLGEATFLEPPADVTGHLHGILDPFDHYAVNLTRDSAYYEFVQVRLSLAGVPVGRADLDLFLIVVEDDVPREVSSSTSNGSSEGAFYAATMESVTVYIRCHAYGGDTSYALNVSKYKVTDDGNNNILRAEELEAGGSKVDGLNLTDRLDYFKVNLTGGDVMWVELASQDWDPVSRKPDLNLYLYSPNGLIINWSHAYDPLERSSVTAPEGDPSAWYYVLVTFFDRNPSDGIDPWGNYTINVTVDRAPVVVADLPLTVEEDGELLLDLDDLVRDPDGDDLNVSFQGVGPVLANVSGDRVLIAPEANFSGLANLTLLASDSLRRVRLSVPVEVTPVPDAPGLVEGLAPLRLSEDGQLSVDLSGLIVDADGDPVTLTALWDANHSLGGSTLEGMDLLVVPDADVFGNLTLAIEAEDGTGRSVTLYLPVEVTPVPDPPRVLAPQVNLTVEEDQRGVEFDLTGMFADPDGRGLRYDVEEATGNILFIVIDHVLVFDPAPDFHGVATLDIEAISGDDRVSAVLRVTVTSVVDPPLFTEAEPDGDVNLVEGDARTFTVTVTDPEGGSLSYTWYVDGVVVPGEDLPRYQLETGFDSPRALLLTLRASNGEADSYWNWSVSVENVNRAPSLTLRKPKGGATFEEGSNVVFEAEVEDPDGEVLSVQWLEDDEVIGTGMSFATSGLDPGKHLVTARVIDPNGAASEANVTFTVEEAGGLPGACGPAAVAAVLLGGVMAAARHGYRRRR